MRRFGKQPFAWNEKATENRNVTSEDAYINNIPEEDSKKEHNITNAKEVITQTCRNSVQGRVLIADDQGMHSRILFGYYPCLNEINLYVTASLNIYYT